MSGHSKWSSIKHQKGVTDARRGKVFTKLTKEIMLAVRQNGANPDTNYHLRLAIQKARDNNMPTDNVARAIKRGEGTLEGANVLAEITLEGYGPEGAAILVEAVTDNRNRTVQEVRSIFTKGGGNLAESGSVTWLFNSRGLITIEADGQAAEDVEFKAIDAGAEDVETQPGLVEIYTKPNELEIVRKALEESGVVIYTAELTKVPKSTIQLDDSKALQVLRLMEKMEEIDDTQNVYTNVDFPEDILEKQAQTK
ncbi:MAG: YebC/PmpR family DNA-binding transcriptional regulator [Dehalococcoidales bacterium]